MSVNYNFYCDICNRRFRDNYNLKRHTERKKNCIVSQPIIINTFGNEDLSHINTDHINEEWNVIHRNNTEDYIRAGNLIVSFHNMVNQNVLISNIKLPYPTSSGVKINTIPKHIHEGIDQTLKIRSGQLLTFKEKISVGENVWKHIEEFHKLGKCYKANKAEHTRIVINCIKFALL
jgi:hypothetical protein